MVLTLVSEPDGLTARLRGMLELIAFVAFMLFGLIATAFATSVVVAAAVTAAISYAGAIIVMLPVFAVARALAGNLRAKSPMERWIGAWVEKGKTIGRARGSQAQDGDER